MQKYGRLKMAHFISIICFAVMVGCLVSIYTQTKTLRAELGRSQQELTANPARTRLATLQDQIEKLQSELSETRSKRDILSKEIADRERIILAQREELKTAAEQLRQLGGAQ